MPKFNDMSHLSIKRFADGDPALRPGAVRARAKLPWDALAEADPSGRSLCKRCGETIPKGDTRLVLLMQCHKGYKTPCTLHFDCFWGHPETAKLGSADEIHIGNGVDKAEAERIRRAFATHRGAGPASARRPAVKAEPATVKVERGAEGRKRKTGAAESKGAKGKKVKTET